MEVLELTCFRFSLFYQAQICLFISIWWWASGRNVIVLSSNVGSFTFALLLKFLSFIVEAINFDMFLLTTTKTSIIVRIKIIEFLTIIPIWRLVLVHVLFQELAEFSGKQVKSFPITALTLFLTSFMTNNFQSNAPHMLLFMLLIIQHVHLVFPKLTEQGGCCQVKSFDSKIVVTLGCQVLSKHLRILMLSSFLSNILLRLMRWFTIEWISFVH